MVSSVGKKNSWSCGRWTALVFGVVTFCNVYYFLPTPDGLLHGGSAPLQMFAFNVGTGSRKVWSLDQMLSFSNDTSRLGKMADLLNRPALPFLHRYRNPCWLEAGPRNAPASSKSPARSKKGVFVNKRHLQFSHRPPGGATNSLRCLPYFMIVGQPKCGTTDLYVKLFTHPDILKPREKEPHWWAKRRFGSLPLPFNGYVNYFSSAAKRIFTENTSLPHRFITGEASASTLWYFDHFRKLPGNANLDEPRFTNAHYVKLLLPKAKIIAILRNPVDRLYSDYLFFAKRTKTSPDLFHRRVVESLSYFANCTKTRTERACAYTMKHRVRLQVGLYSIFISDWLSVFPRDQIAIIRLEDYSADRLATLNRLCRFLDISPFSGVMSANINGMSVSNARRDVKKSKKTTMFESTRRLLEKFYAPFNDQLAALLGDHAYTWPAEQSPSRTT